jgi:hypothetical protein
MAALQNLKILQRDVAAILQGDGLIADAGIFRFGAGAVTFA